MPELPEVEIVKRSLNKKIKGKIIQEVSVKNRNLRFKLANNQLWESQSVLSTIKLNNFRVKNNIVIEEANMGGFWMINKSSNVKIKVKRIS